MEEEEGVRMVLECSKCGHRWLEEKIEFPMKVKAFLAHVRGFDCCPRCSQKGAVMLIGEKFREAIKEFHSE